jgi:hypothetical protein
MNPEPSLYTTKITRKHFLQLSFISLLGLLMWSPFRESTRALLPTTITDALGPHFSFSNVKDIKMMTQVEYDALTPDKDTLYVIS